MISTLMFAFLASSSAAQSTLRGDPNCPCVGNDKIPNGQQIKEIGYGTDCRAWDRDMSYCTDEENGEGGWNEGSEWCGQEWCYVDRDNCNAVILDNGSKVDPKVTQSVIYPTVELYFSYNTCGNEDKYHNSGTVWIWDFGTCEDRTANDYYLLVDGSASVLDQWSVMRDTLEIVMTEGLSVEGDRVGMMMFSGKRAANVADVETVFTFEDSREDAVDALRKMENMGGQTWTTYGIMATIEQWKKESVIDDEDRLRILCVITDGRPKPRNHLSSAPGDSEEPGCITAMLDEDLPICENGQKKNCRFLNCNDLTEDERETTDCCPGEQSPCKSDQKDALIAALKDNDILIAFIAVGEEGLVKSAPYNCHPEGCTPGGRDECTCESDVYYFDCLTKDDYDEQNDVIPWRISAIENFSKFFQYKDPTASTEGGNDGQMCIDPKVLQPPAPPTKACTEIPEPKDVVIVLDSSKSMYTTKQRGGTTAENWLAVMKDLQKVVCLYNADADVASHRCAFTIRDNVGLVRFATDVKTEYDFNSEDNWWSNVRFTQLEDGDEVAAMNRKDLRSMTDTVAALWEAFDMMNEMNESEIVLKNGETRAKRREVILVTDGRPHCRRDEETLCRPCAPKFREVTLEKQLRANAQVKIVWRGDRATHDGSITVDKDQLADEEWFGCLDIDFDSDKEFVVVGDFDEDAFRDALVGDLVCVQDLN